MKARKFKNRNKLLRKWNFHKSNNQTFVVHRRIRFVKIFFHICFFLTRMKMLQIFIQVFCKKSKPHGTFFFQQYILKGTKKVNHMRTIFWNSLYTKFYHYTLGCGTYGGDGPCSMFHSCCSAGSNPDCRSTTTGMTLV